MEKEVSMETNTASPFPYVRDFGQVISATVEFIRQHISSLYKILFVFVAPLAAIAGIFTSFAITDYFSWIHEFTQNPDFGSFGSFIGTLIMSYGVLLIAYLLCLVVTTEYCIAIHKQGSDNFNVKDFIRQCLRQTPRYVVLSIVSVFLLVLSYLFFIIPGIYFSVNVLIIFPVMANEKLSSWQTIKRSMTLMQGHWWSTFGLYLVVYIAVGIIVGIFTLPMYIGMGLNMFFSKASPGEVPSYISVLSIFFTMISIVAQVILYSVYQIVFTFKYFSILEIKEGGSLFTAISQIGSSHDSSLPEETY